MSNTFKQYPKKFYSFEQINQLNVYNSQSFEAMYHYDGDDLGALYSPFETTFKVWSPLALEVNLCLYTDCTSSTRLECYPMESHPQGVWACTLPGDLHGLYYTYEFTHMNGVYEVVDIYAKAVGVNGLKGMVVDLDRTHPDGWEKDTFISTPSPVDAIIYELHVRDFSISPTTSHHFRGKYLAFTEKTTQTPAQLSSGLAHLKALGITHVHLLPVYDFDSIDEGNLESSQYNWGYDPLHYNVPEGSYATNPFDGSVRIKEFKSMVKALHDEGIGVIMDVVYNHTAQTLTSCFHGTMPYYYHRCHSDGSFNNGSGCGNEIASERSMVRQMIIDSVVFWAKEYHIDGFRFDLMGILDCDTLNAIRLALDDIHPDLLMYGEGWVASPTLLPIEKSAIKINTPKLHPRIASFSDDMRDAIKGHVFYEKERGFVSGHQGLCEAIKFGIVGSTHHPQVHYDQVNYSKAPWALAPTQCITYASAHDNLTLFDKLQVSAPHASYDQLVQMNKMAATLVLCSQGIPFIHAGEEMLRTKVGIDGHFDHNSYKSPDCVNAIDWNRKHTHYDVFCYYQGLIQLRKAHPAFRMRTQDAIQKHLTFLSLASPHAVGYSILNYPNDTWQSIYVFFNPTESSLRVALPLSEWLIVVDSKNAGIVSLGSFKGDTFTLPPYTHYILVDAKSFYSNGC